MSTAQSLTGPAIKALEGTPLERVERLRDVIVDGGNRAQELRRLPEDTVETLIDEGMFRFTLPAELGGENATTLETIEILEAISAIDASVGWNVMLGSEINAMAAGGMEKALAKEIYLDNPRVVMCGGGGTGSVPATAVRQPDGGFKVTGESTFISGCWNSEWCFMPAPEVEKGQSFADADMSTFQMRFMHRSEWEIVEAWDVAGIRGSGSDNVRAEGSRVLPEHAGVDLVVMPPHYDNPVFRVPVPLRLSFNKVAIALGVARGAIDAFVDLAHNKVPMLSPSKLMDRPIAQIRVGECEGKFRAARAYVMEAMGNIEDELNSGAELPSAMTTQDARLACIAASNMCMEVVDVMHNTAGTSASYMANPLERKLRDSHAAASHRWTSHSLYQDMGAIVMGHDPAPEFAGTGGPGWGSRLVGN
ncbi:MAG: acyl-CoA dehydrogenase family protein [Acidimicrobiales bacterium]